MMKMVNSTKKSKSPSVVTKSIKAEVVEEKVIAKKPTPRFKEADKPIVNVNGLPEYPAPKKNQKYNYDHLGNVLGFYIAPKNIVDEEDDQNEKNRKIAAQQAVLPCSGPKPRW